MTETKSNVEVLRTGEVSFRVRCPISSFGFNFLSFEVGGKDEAEAVANVKGALTDSIALLENYVTPEPQVEEKDETALPESGALVHPAPTETEPAPTTTDDATSNPVA